MACRSVYVKEGRRLGRGRSRQEGMGGVAWQGFPAMARAGAGEFPSVPISPQPALTLRERPVEEGWQALSPSPWSPGVLGESDFSPHQSRATGSLCSPSLVQAEEDAWVCLGADVVSAPREPPSYPGPSQWELELEPGLRQ